MAKNLTRSHALILPLVLLMMVLLEDIAALEVRARVHNLPLRVAALMALYGAGFTFAANTVAPWLKKVLVGARRNSRAALGPWGFYALAYAVLYAIYYAWEASSPTAPPSAIISELLT